MTVRRSQKNTGRPPVPNRIRTTLLGLVLPLVVLALALGWAFTLLPQLPDRVATHWNAAGVADGFGSPLENLVMLVAIVVPFTVGMWAMGFVLGSTASTRRMAVFLSVWFSVWMSGLLVGTLALQSGLDDVSQAGGVGPALGISLGIATVLGVIAAALIPGDRSQPTTAPVPDDAERLSLGAAEQAVWVRTVELPHLSWFVGCGIALTVVLGALGMLAGTGFGVATALTTALITLVFVLFTRWTMTIDNSGFSARPAIPFPHVHVPLDEVESAEVTEVQPFADFGGWGFRIDTNGRVGIVIRAGEAILIHRTGGRRLVATVDDAETGVALLNTLADRSRLR